MKTISQLACLTWGSVSREDRRDIAFALYSAECKKRGNRVEAFDGLLRDRWLRKVYAKHAAARAKHLKGVAA